MLVEETALAETREYDVKVVGFSCLLDDDAVLEYAYVTPTTDVATTAMYAVWRSMKSNYAAKSMPMFQNCLDGKASSAVFIYFLAGWRLSRNAPHHGIPPYPP